MVLERVAKILAKQHSQLENKLQRAGLVDDPESYVKKNLTMSLLLGTGISIILFLFIQNLLALLSALIFIPIAYLYFNRYVDVRINNLRKNIDSEIIFAGNFLMIELDSGVPIHRAFENLEKNYEYVGRYFGEIANKVYLGTSMQDAINDTIQSSPSSNLRRILWQILNSMKTGSNPAPALKSVIDNIVREQQIAVKEYGKKLRPMAMFYMMISIIVPSLGITMLVVFGSFLGLNMGLWFFLIIAFFIGFMQFMFLSIIRSQRPPLSV